MGNSEKKTFLIRLASGCVLFIAVVAAILISRYTFFALLLAICIGAMVEFYRLSSTHGTSPQRILGSVTGVLMITGALLYTDSHNYTLNSIGLLVPLLLLLLVFIVFIAELFRKKETPLANIAVTICGIFYVALPLSLLIFISTGGGLLFPPLEIPSYKPGILLSFIFVIWANDVGAYLAGVTLGKHRMFPRVSPKKSWEGFAGGVVAAVGIGILCGWVMHQNLAFWAGLGALASVFGVLGDLVESMFKRSVGIKDSGTMMPGHGGWLDRFDSLLVATPFVFVYFIIFALI